MIDAHLLMDVGNSAIKVIYADRLEQQTIMRFVHGEYHIIELLGAVFRQRAFSRLSLASVYQSELTHAIVNWCRHNSIDCYQAVTATSHDGLKNGYVRPETLGVDRWLAMLAAWQMRRRDFFIVSCGTALTFDAVNASGEHLGGAIMPGPLLMMQALSEHTSALEMPQKTSTDRFMLADNTQEGILFGTENASIGFVEQMLGVAGMNLSNGLFFGGCANIFKRHYGLQVQVDDLLIFRGLLMAAGGQDQS